MSTFNVGDILLAKDEDTGEEYYVYGEQDESWQDWRYDEEPIGEVISWTTEGSELARFCSQVCFSGVWRSIIKKLFKYDDTDSVNDGDEDVPEYIQSARKLLDLMLKYGNYAIISKKDNKALCLLHGIMDEESEKPYLLINDPRIERHKDCKCRWLNWWVHLSTDTINELTREDAETIFYAACDSDYEDCINMLDNLEGVAVIPFWESSATEILSLIPTGFSSRHPDGCFICYKEGNYMNTPYWKDSYYDYVSDLVRDYNAIQEGYTFRFCAAKVEDVKKLYLDKIKNQLKFCTECASRKDFSKQFVHLFDWGISVRDCIEDACDDSCGDYHDEDYEGLMYIYLDDLGLKFVEVIDKQCQKQ